MQITNNSNGSGVRVNLIKGVSSEFIAEALTRINEQELNIIGYNSQTKTYRDEASVLRDNAQSSANNANNSALLSTVKANEANLSANNAKEWASKEYGLEVETGLYSAKHYAIEASNNTSKVTSINGMIGDVVLSKSDVGLWSVDNTSDINKPISNDTQTALDLKANVVNAVLTGIPTAPTAPVGTNTTQLATTAYVKAEVANETYTKAQVDAKLASQNDASEINVTPTGNMTSTNVQAALVELQGDINNRYTKTEVDTKLAGQNDASEISVTPNGNMVSTNVQDALVELQLDVDDRYTKAQADTLLAGKVDKTVFDAANLNRADKYLANQNIVNMLYTNGDLTKIRYRVNSDTDYETLSYVNGNLTTINHYINAVLKGTTTLSYGAGNLVSAVFVAA